MNESDIYTGNKATTFQPPTGNPQQNGQNNLQRVNGSLQPNATSSKDGSQEFPAVQELKVSAVTNRPSSTTATISQPNSDSSASFPIAFSVGIVLLVTVMVIVIWLASPADKVPPTEVNDKADKDSKENPAEVKASPEDKPAVATKPTKKPATKKKKSNKRTKAKRR